MAAKRLKSPRRGEVWLVHLDPTRGREIRKTRPAVVLQNDVANRWSPITIVAAITSGADGAVYDTEVEVAAGEGGLPKPSLVLLNQIRSVDAAERLVRRLGRLNPSTLRRVDRALRISLGLVDLEA